MVRYQNLTRKPELFRAPLGPDPGTMYPLNPPLAGPVCNPGFDHILKICLWATFFLDLVCDPCRLKVDYKKLHAQK